MAALVEPASVRLLFATPVGSVLIVAAVGMSWAGRRWMRLLVERAVAAGRPR
jgi:Flp pilus assembly protein TadB